MYFGSSRSTGKLEVSIMGTMGWGKDRAGDDGVSQACQGAVSEGYECTDQSKPSRNNLSSASPRR
jgi:hypothetical protein